MRILSWVAIAMAVSVLCACHRVVAGHGEPDGGRDTAARAGPPSPVPSGSSEADGLSPTELEIAHGKASYEKYCKLCHGADAVGYAADHANQLSNPLFLAATGGTPFLFIAIADGRPGTPMGGFSTKAGGPLEPEEITEIISYLRSLPAIDHTRVAKSDNAIRGRDLFKTNCTKCHGENGEGGSAPSLNNPFFLATASDAFLRYAIEFGRPGTPMQSYSGRLSSADIDDLSRYVRSWARSPDYRQKLGEPIPALDRIILNPASTSPRMDLEGGRYVSAEQLLKALTSKQRLVLLDARVTSDWIASHIPGSYPAPFYDALDQKLVDALPRDGTWIVAYCSCPHAASNEVVDALRKHGFTNTAVVNEGFLEWTKRRYPVTVGK